MAMRRRLMECGCAVEFPVAAIAVIAAIALIVDGSLISWTCAEQIADRDLSRTSFPRTRTVPCFRVADQLSNAFSAISPERHSRVRGNDEQKKRSENRKS
jgi:hypothetical protein